MNIQTVSNCTKRLIFEIKIYETQKEFLNKSGIFLDYNTDDLTIMRLLIIGPENTPYQGGFYFFNVNIPPNYPFIPPKFTFLNKIDNVRFHPNFYVEGYVCLSILNTWGKNEWSPCQSISSIASTIQSVMNENPIINEPEYENETGIIAQDYCKIIEYYNLYGSVSKIIKKPLIGFNNFIPIVESYFLSNIDKYLKVIEKNKHLNDERVTCQIYSLSVKLDYKSLENDILFLKSNIKS
jgi:ubiquitin-conjugating enzyme E2 Z